MSILSLQDVAEQMNLGWAVGDFHHVDRDGRSTGLVTAMVWGRAGRPPVVIRHGETIGAAARQVLDYLNPDLPAA